MTGSDKWCCKAKLIPSSEKSDINAISTSSQITHLDLWGWLQVEWQNSRKCTSIRQLSIRQQNHKAGTFMAVLTVWGLTVFLSIFHIYMYTCTIFCMWKKINYFLCLEKSTIFCVCQQMLIFLCHPWMATVSFIFGLETYKTMKKLTIAFLLRSIFTSRKMLSKTSQYIKIERYLCNFCVYRGPLGDRSCVKIVLYHLYFLTLFVSL